jgi:hypothetical protein
MRKKFDLALFIYKIFNYVIKFPINKVTYLP